MSKERLRYDGLDPNLATKFLAKSRTRQEVKALELMRRSTVPSKADSKFKDYVFQSAKTPEAKAALKVLWAKLKGRDRYIAGDVVGAKKAHQEGLQNILDVETRVFRSEFYNPDYFTKFKSTNVDSWKLHLDVVACCIGIAQYHMEHSVLPEALDWLDEVEVLYACIDMLFANEDETYKTYEYYTNQMNARMMAVKIFKYLRNTAAAAYYSEQCQFYRIPKYLLFLPEINSFMEASKKYTTSFIRHPILADIDNWDVQDDTLQIRGIWDKISLRSKLRPPGRQLSVHWTWHNRLYIHGRGGEGGKSESYTFSDIWYLDTKKMDKWTRLPDVPVKYRKLAFRGRHAVVYDNCAWIFTGQRDILHFNMISESWETVATTMTGLKGHKWPYTAKGARDPCIALLDNLMYAFGGDLQEQLEGSDIFMVLDLKSLRWRFLGDSTIYERSDYPGKCWPPRRRNAGCWIVLHEKRFYLIHGTQSYESYLERYDTEEACDPYCPDLWSYSIEEEIWSRERLRGNFPCPREDAAIAYHPGLNSVILFGGVNQYMHGYSTLPEGLEESSMWDFVQNRKFFPDVTFSYFGDTFILDISTRSWRQVVTRVFPCWMGGAYCFVDESTGDTFLYGGCVFREYVAGEKINNKAYRYLTDIHRLDIQHAGSRFRIDKFLEGSMKYLKLGCWRRCNTCKQIGKNYYKCRGLCEGRVIYCSKECQQKGWRVHRHVHGCRKV